MQFVKMKPPPVIDPQDLTMGERLKDLRERKTSRAGRSKYPSTAEVASATGLGAGTINALENNANDNPRAATLINLARYYGVTTDYILGLSSEPNNVAGQNPLAVAISILSELKYVGGDPHAPQS
jgi:transcriptional regulator with XRE-family HTH domain